MREGAKDAIISVIFLKKGAFFMNDLSLERIQALLARIDCLMAERERVIVAVDGGSASGKTTLGALLQSVYACPVFHMDDFFLRPEQRTPERFRMCASSSAVVVLPLVPVMPMTASSREG